MAAQGRRLLRLIIKGCGPLNEPVCSGISSVNADLSSTLATLTPAQISSHYRGYLVNERTRLNASPPLAAPLTHGNVCFTMSRIDRSTEGPPTLLFAWRCLFRLRPLRANREARRFGTVDSTDLVRGYLLPRSKIRRTRNVDVSTRRAAVS